MLHADIVKVNLRRTRPLVVVARLEVALRCIQLVGGQGLGIAAVDAHAQLVVLVADLVGELRVERHVADLGHDLVAAGARLLDAHGQVAVLRVVQLADGLARHAVVDVDLPDHRAVLAVVRLHDRQRRAQPVRRRVGIPAGGVAARGVHLAQLRAAVLAVGRRHAAGRRRVAGDLHDQRPVAAVGVEVVAILVAVAAVELARGDGRRAAGRADR